MTLKELVALAVSVPVIGVALATGVGSLRFPVQPAQNVAGDSARRAPPPAPTERKTNVTLTEKDTLRFAGNESVFRVSQFLKNDSDGIARVDSVFAAIRDSSGTIRSWSDTLRALLPPWRITPLTFEFRPVRVNEPQVGHFVIRLFDSTSRRFYALERPLKIMPNRPARGSPWAEAIVIGALAVAVIITATAVQGPIDKATKKRPDTVKVASDAKWNPTASWASNVGVAGAIITVLLTVAVPNEQTRLLTKTAYTFLSTVFLTITALAPSAYVMAARSGTDQDRGRWAVGIPSALTLWGALGQVLLAGALFVELGNTRVLPWTPIGAFMLLLAVLFVMLSRYGWRSVQDIATPATSKAPTTAAAAAPPPSYTLL